MMIFKLNYPTDQYSKPGECDFEVAYVNPVAIESLEIQPWHRGRGDAEERGSFVYIYYQQHGIQCRENDDGVSELIQYVNVEALKHQ
jgi:hypothetical protein